MFDSIKALFASKKDDSLPDFPDESYFASRYTLAEVALAIADDTKKPFQETLKYLRKIVRSK